MPLLKLPPFRQASSRLGPNSGMLVDFGGAKRVVKPQETTPGGADGRKTVTTGPPHGPGDSLSSPLRPERKGAQLMPVQSAHCAPEKSQ